tara:strand:+ start:176 stop:370 length:195 start_codon:yes stop_codon:yes gene_type:complete
LIPHDQYPPPKKPERVELTFMDYGMICMTTFGVYTSLAIASFFNLLLVALAWRFYEKYRSGENE